MFGYLLEMSVRVSRGLTKMSRQKRSSREATSGTSTSIKKAKQQATKQCFRNGRENTIGSTRLSPGFVTRWIVIRCTLRPYTVRLVRSMNAICSLSRMFMSPGSPGPLTRKSAISLDHAGSGVHKAALARKRAEAARARGESVAASRLCNLCQSDALCRRLIFPREQGWDRYSTCAL